MGRSRVGNGDKHARVQASILHSGIEALDEAIFNWFAGLGEIQLDLVRIGPRV
jgi:hypothetical protein